ncbi:MAG TPA: HAD family phosphatase [Flavisolibacter sp.]|nr:HAD family phosphatase [Flavisolibacter sp.]
MNLPIKAIIWDLGNVFVDWNPNHLFQSLIEDEVKRKYFFDNICTMDWNENQDAGYPIQKATEELVAKHPEWKEHIEAYYGRWEEMLGGPIQGTVDIFKQVKEKGHLKHYALTNWSHELFPTALRLYDFMHWFDGRVVSGEERMRKPQPEFYQVLLDRYNLQVSDVIFIDDNLRNVKAAEAMGIKSIRFESPEQLKLALKELQIL